MADVSCHGCGDVMDEPGDLPPEECKPCPACGETKRGFSIQLQRLQPQPDGNPL